MGTKQTYNNVLIKSRYNFSRFIFLLVVILTFLLTVFVTYRIGFWFVNFESNNEALYVSLVLIPINIILLIFYIKRCKLIKIYDEGMSFSNPIVPFISKNIEWSSIDYCVLYDDIWKHGTYESIYFVANKTVKYKISSQFYKNYGAMKQKIPFELKKKVHFSSFWMAPFIKLGFKKINEKNTVISEI